MSGTAVLTDITLSEDQMYIPVEGGPAYQIYQVNPEIVVSGWEGYTAYSHVCVGFVDNHRGKHSAVFPIFDDGVVASMDMDAWLDHEVEGHDAKAALAALGYELGGGGE